MIRLVLLLPLLLAACGNLPQPFFGNPGASATRLAQPPASRLEVPPPARALLSNAAARAWAQVTAAALVEQEVPAIAGPRPRSNEWTLVLAADLRGGNVIPSYTIRNPAGQPQGAAEGAPVAAAEWARATPATLRAAAAEAAPGIAALLTRIEAARQQSDPKSLLNRPARIYFTGVTGAPGDGDASLAAQMRRKLETQGLVVQDTAKGADYKLGGTVETAPGANGTMRVEIQWVVANATDEVGRIAQINEVPPATVSGYWGDVAVVVASEAAGGVRDVVLNASGKRKQAAAER